MSLTQHQLEASRQELSTERAHAAELTKQLASITSELAVARGRSDEAAVRQSCASLALNHPYHSSRLAYVHSHACFLPLACPV